MMLLTIYKSGWVLENRAECSLDTSKQYYPDDGRLSENRWTIGPIELVRILRRIGLTVKVEVEP